MISMWNIAATLARQDEWVWTNDTFTADALLKLSHLLINRAADRSGLCCVFQVVLSH